MVERLDLWLASASVTAVAKSVKDTALPGGMAGRRLRRGQTRLLTPAFATFLEWANCRNDIFLFPFINSLAHPSQRVTSFSQFSKRDMNAADKRRRRGFEEG